MAVTYSIDVFGDKSKVVGKKWQCYRCYKIAINKYSYRYVTLRNDVIELDLSPSETAEQFVLSSP